MAVRPWLHFVFNSFQSAINSISTRWIDWAVELNESLRFTCFAVPFNFHSLRVMKLNCGCSHVVSFPSLIPFTLHYLRSLPSLRVFHSIHFMKWNEITRCALSFSTPCHYVDSCSVALPSLRYTPFRYHYNISSIAINLMKSIKLMHWSGYMLPSAYLVPSFIRSHCIHWSETECVKRNHEWIL